MDRLISLFREAGGGDGGKAPVGGGTVIAEPNPEYAGQPDYFVQLMEYLRARREDDAAEDLRLIPEDVVG